MSGVDKGVGCSVGFNWRVTQDLNLRLRMNNRTLVRGWASKLGSCLTWLVRRFSCCLLTWRFHDLLWQRRSSEVILAEVVELPVHAWYLLLETSGDVAKCACWSWVRRWSKLVIGLRHLRVQHFCRLFALIVLIRDSVLSLRRDESTTIAWVGLSVLQV